MQAAEAVRAAGVAAGKVNLTDPDSRVMKGKAMFVQAHNAQAVVTEQEIVLAAEISTEPVDFSLLAPMMTATRRELEQAGIDATPKAAVADAGYWNERHMDQLAADGIAVLIRPDSGNRKDERRGWTGGRYSSMRQLLATDLGAELYRKRRHTIEPMFGHTKHNRKFTHFHRRGRAAVRTEWRFLMATHNLTKAPHPPDSHPGGLNGPHAGPGGRSGPIRTTSPRATPVDRGRSSICATASDKSGSRERPPRAGAARAEEPLADRRPS